MVHLASYTEPSPWLTIGQVFDPAAGSAKAQATGLTAKTDGIYGIRSNHALEIMAEGVSVTKQ